MMIRINYSYDYSNFSDDLVVENQGSLLLTCPYNDFTIEKAKKVIETLVPTLFPSYRSYVTRIDKVAEVSTTGRDDKVIFDRLRNVVFEEELRRLGYLPSGNKPIFGGLPAGKLITYPRPDTYVTKEGDFPRYRLEVYWGYKDFEDSQSIMKVECYQLVDGKKEELVSLPMEEMRVISKFT